MNKKIIERLVDESTMYVARSNSTIFDASKFAELIVQECITIADDLVNRNTDGTWTSNELYTDYNGALFEVKRRIEEHFRIKS